MSAMPTKAYHPKCDTCGALLDDAEYGEVTFGDPTAALEYAADMGWLRDGNQLTCPSCLRCARCGEWPAWVGGEGLSSHGQILCDSCEPGPARITNGRTALYATDSEIWPPAPAEPVPWRVRTRGAVKSWLRTRVRTAGGRIAHRFGYVHEDEAGGW